MRRLGGWFKSLSLAGKVGVILATFFGIGVVGAAAQGPAPTPPKPASTNATSIQQPKPTVETKTETTTVSIPYTSSTVQDSTLAKGTTQNKTAGVNGVKTQTWSVTYTNGVETNRTLVSEVVTTQPVNEVIAQGTYVAPAVASDSTNCPNGTYTNSAGNVVCSPYASTSAPSGATAKCNDGTYSFSQTHSGTCSHHGGVATWL